jgi:hypothetical protein
MPFDLSSISPKPRRVDVPGVGVIMVREPTMADYTSASTDPYWWAGCLSCIDGTPFVHNNADMANVSADICSALLAEINRERFTTPPNGGSGESQTPSNA